VRVLSEVAIYPWIENPYGLNEHPRIKKVLEFNHTKGLAKSRDLFIDKNRPIFTVFDKIDLT
jgi:hypothetical protein